MNLKERIELAKEQLGISEVDTQALEKALGKKLVDYESTEALVAALMGYYNGELKKKANTSHTHDYAPSSHKHKKADISDFPTSMKNPYALSIQLNSGTAYTYDGAATKNINITPASIGAADSSHTHTKANITDFPTSMKNPNALEIKMNGQNPVSYDGAAAKSINITPGSIGSYTKQEVDTKVNGKANTNHTHPYLPTSGGTISGNLTVTGTGIFNGHLTSQNEVTAFSDRALKGELKVISNAVDKVKKVTGYTYKMLGSDKRQAGVIAQEIREVLPEVVVENDCGYLSVAYGNISALIIEAIKEIDERLTKIENELSGGVK